MISMNTVTLISAMGRAAFHLTPILWPHSQHMPVPLGFFKCSLAFVLLLICFWDRKMWPKPAFSEWWALITELFLAKFSCKRSQKHIIPPLECPHCQDNRVRGKYQLMKSNAAKESPGGIATPLATEQGHRAGNSSPPLFCVHKILRELQSQPAEKSKYWYFNTLNHSSLSCAVKKNPKPPNLEAVDNLQ